jgi:hypothetical protein
MVYGTIKAGDKTSILTAGKLNGDKITFTAEGETYSGRVTSNSTMAGTVTSGSGIKEWIATR